MADDFSSGYSLVPVDYQPQFEGVTLVPVDHNPFADDGHGPQLAQAQAINSPQQPATGASPPDVGAPIIGDGGQFSAGTAIGNKVADIGSKVAYGLAHQILTLPQRAIDASAMDVQHLGEDGYNPQSIGPAVETATLTAGMLNPFRKPSGRAVGTAAIEADAMASRSGRAEALRAAPRIAQTFASTGLDGVQWGSPLAGQQINFAGRSTGSFPAALQTLYHYTDEAGLNGILSEGKLNPSLKAINPSDARYGNGQYFSDIPPDTMRPAQLSRVFVTNPFQGNRFTHYLEINPRGLSVVQGRPGVYVVPNETPLNLDSRIISSGKVTGR